MRIPSLNHSWGPLSQTSSVLQAGLPAWHGGTHWKEGECNPAHGAPKLLFRGTQSNYLFLLCGPLGEHLDALGQQLPNFLSDSRRGNQIILSICFILLCSFNIVTEGNFLNFLAFIIIFFGGNENGCLSSPGARMRISLTSKVTKKAVLCPWMTQWSSPSANRCKVAKGQQQLVALTLSIPTRPHRCLLPASTIWQVLALPSLALGWVIASNHGVFLWSPYPRHEHNCHTETT